MTVVLNNMESIRTHSRYVGNIYAGLYNKNLIFKLQDLPYDTFDVVSTEKIIKKISIVEHTLKSLRQEKVFSDDDQDFKPLAISWLWIKGYYCIFHLISIIIAFEKKDSRYVLDKKYNSHVKIQNIFNDGNVMARRADFFGRAIDDFVIVYATILRNQGIF